MRRFLWQLKIIVFVILVLFFIGFPIKSYCDDWPNWRGPHSNGVSSETDWNPRALSNPVIHWQMNVGVGHSSVVVVGDYCYTMGNQQIDGVFQDVILCMDVRTGREIWRHTYSCPFTSYPGPRTTPAIDGNFIFTLSWQGNVFCLDKNTGKMKWNRNLVADSLAKVPSWGFCGSPVVEDDLLILNAGELGIALDKDTGKVVWKSGYDFGSLITPAIFSSGSKRYATFPSGRALNAINVKTGESEWWYPWYKSLDIDPIFFDNKMFIAGYRGCKLVEIDGNEYRVLMENRETRFEAFQNFVVLNGYAYGFGRVGQVTPFHCVDILTGEVKWTQDFGPYGSVSAANDKLIIITGDGRLIIAEADSSGYKEISETQLFGFQHNEQLADPDKEICWTQPVLSHGRIFVRSNKGHLVCLDMRI